jgi:hypothetical protein
MTINETLLEVREYTGDGYRPIIDYGAWRVAILRYDSDLEPHAINTMQRHDETDEVFVLLSGRCILFLGEGSDTVDTIHAEDMQLLKAYNVKKGAWHSHTLDQDATVLIVENRDTNDTNSPTFSLTAAQTSEIVQLTNQLWTS